MEGGQAALALPREGSGKPSIKIHVALLMRSDNQNEPFPPSSQLQKEQFHTFLSLSLSLPPNARLECPKKAGRKCTCRKNEAMSVCWQIMSSLGRWPHGKQPLQFRRPKEWRPKVCRGGRASFEVFVAAICIPRSIF